MNGVPAGQSGLFVEYKIDKGLNASTSWSSKVALTQGSSSDGGRTYSWSGTVSNTFIATSVIDWRFGTNNDDTTTVSGGTNQGFTAGEYPVCAETNSATFPTATVSGTKYEDLNSNGTKDAGEPPLQGFQFQLKSGTTVLQTAYSNSSGGYSFSNVAPGTYAVHEVLPSGWKQTQPVDATTGAAVDRTVTVSFGDSTDSVDPFGNTPLSDIQVTFNSDGKLQQATGGDGTTGATKATDIKCTWTDGTGTAHTINETTTTNTLSVPNQELNKSPITCTISYTNN